MSWKLSRFRAGDLVAVRSKEEILATLDAQGCIDGMPFMPEMLQYCGRRIRVGAVAHKTCDVARQTLKSRRLNESVHLVGTRCDGSAHGGCQAECNLFWKDAWLKPAESPETEGTQLVSITRREAAGGIGEDELWRSTRLPSGTDAEPVYSCQATRLFDATRELSWWDPRQYLRDVWSRNHTLGHALAVLILAGLRHLHRSAPRGYRLTHGLYSTVHRWFFGRDLPDFQGTVAPHERTPTGRLGLQPGDRVRIKSKAEIEATLDGKGRNRGLYYDVELSPYCGQVRTVRKAVTQIIHEVSGKMLHITGNPCIMLEGVACKAEYSTCRLLCPREIPSYWREIWLEPVDRVEHPAP